MKHFLTIIISIIIFSIYLLITPTVNAQNIDITVSPPISYLHVPPGTKRTHTVTLENENSLPITIEPAIVDFYADGTSGKPVLSNKLSFPYISFLNQDEKTLTIPPNSKAQLTLLIDVPLNEPEKEYPLSILFFSQQTDDSYIDSTHSKVQAAIGSNLVVLVAKDNKLQHDLSVKDFNAPTVIDSFAKLKLAPIINNDSFSTSAVSGTIRIVNWKKQTLVEYEIYPDNILGNSSREIRALISSENKENPETASFIYKPKFLIGPYQIIINLTNENGDITHMQSHVFYALPFSLLAILVVGIALTLIYNNKIDQR